jgi:hypothetical protein
MKLGSVLEGLMLKLSVIPGLGFLASYVTEFRGRTTVIQQKIGAYKGYVRAARDAGADVAEAGRGLRRNEEPEEEEEVEEDYEEDDESYLQ